MTAEDLPSLARWLNEKLENGCSNRTIQPSAIGAVMRIRRRIEVGEYPNCSMLAREFGVSGPTPAGCANTHQSNGWAEVLQGLEEPDMGIAPRLFVHEIFKHLAKTLPASQYYPNQPEDELKVDADEGRDDAADTLAYLLATKSRTVAQRKLAELSRVTHSARTGKRYRASFPNTAKSASFPVNAVETEASYNACE